jgi:phosphate:Na+ symporter
VLATIGFITAGMLSLASAIPIVAGATVGTSSTTWIVAIVGLSPGIASVLLPLLAAGALMRTVGRGQWRHVGTAVAGLTVILLSIAFIRGNVGPIAEAIDISARDAGSPGGRLSLVGIGILLAVAMQSSAAPIALAIVAMHGGAVGWDQAAHLTIGATVGTTSTGMLATIGTRASARRVSAAWAACAAVQAALALLLYPWLREASEAVGRTVGAGTGAEPRAVAIAAFHTGFTAIGALPVLLGTNGLARALARSIPDRGGLPPVVEYDRSALDVPGIAAATARRGLAQAGVAVTELAMLALRGAQGSALEERIEDAGASLEATRAFLGEIHVPEGEEGTVEMQRGTVGALDHLTRMAGDVRNLLRASRGQTLARTEVRRYLDDAAGAVATLEAWLHDPAAPPPTAELRRISADLGARRKRERSETLNRTATGGTAPDIAIAELDALRAADRIVHHAAKAAAYLAPRNGSPTMAGGAAGADVAEEPS